MPTTLKERLVQPETMDGPDVAEGRHAQALRGLARINRITRSAHTLAQRIAAAFPEPRDEPIRVLDIATGGGDIALGLWRIARHWDQGLAIEGCDISPVAVQIAKENAARLNADVTFFTQDVLTSSLPKRYDAIVCSHFLHHLSEAQAKTFLTGVTSTADGVVLIQDLVRCRPGYWLAYFGARALTRSPIVHVDAPRSVQAAFTPDEVETLAKSIELANFTITRHWPFRFLFEWQNKRP